MYQSARRIAARLLPDAAKHRLRSFRRPRQTEFCKHSFSQEGEDRLLVSLFELDNHPGRTGFYVDIGAHHPMRVSNTHLLYLRGWRGINVDPLPGTKVLFDKIRRLDINLEVGVSAARGKLTYYMFNEPVFNGFDADLARGRDGYQGLEQRGTREIETLPLSDLLTEHLPQGQGIDLLSVDVEGLDLVVLQSNDWKRFRPSVVAVEDGELVSMADIGSSRICKFMDSVGYGPYCKTPLTTFFIERGEVVVRPFGMRIRKYDSPNPESST